ncbi:MAG: chemotaxis protein CheB [Rhodanobacter sp.]
MTDMAPAVALLFDDTELGGHLRDALLERGARIVHEGDVSGVSRELLQQIGADVLVVNLDNDADDAFDRLYDLLDGDRPRVVLNDSQASRSLVGWDRARWARHLAVKVLAAGDIDPPRPADARAIEAPSVELASPEAETPEPGANEQASGQAAVVAQTPPLPAEDSTMTEPLPASEPVSEPDTVEEPAAPPPADELMPHDEDFSVPEPTVSSTEGGSAQSSEDLAAELEALLASGELPVEDGEESLGSGLRFSEDEELPALHDGDFGVPPPEPAAFSASNGGDGDAATSVAPTYSIRTEHLQLAETTETGIMTEPAAAPEPTPASAPAVVSAPDGWALVDENTPIEPADWADPASFGVEKVSAEEFLAPNAEPASSDVEPTMSLELVSLEASVAPQAYVQDHEMLLDDLSSALSRIVLLGAGVDGLDSVGAFLAALPGDSRLTLVLTQHLGSQPDAALAEALDARCVLPVRLADPERRAGAGEVLMVPAGQQIRLRRDGKIELQPLGTEGVREPSIDASLTMAANVFGRDAVAIVFSGRGNDAVAGAQAIHDRGGQVWVESSSGEHFADMVSGIFAERLVSYSGTPSELAAHLIEVFP